MPALQVWLGIFSNLPFRYKSNEDYVYVRGRGRGKYICEECGIRCKKPSMLKKHIRTHTDVRPYICRVCNFAFKTKGEVVKNDDFSPQTTLAIHPRNKVTIKFADVEKNQSLNLPQDLK